MRCFTMAAIGSGLLTVMPSWAAAFDAGSDYLDEIVVTATRIPTPLATLTSDVSVLSAEDIRKSGASSLVELLRGQGGIEISHTGGPGKQSSLFIRGANANHTLVLVDGMRIQSATVGTTAVEHIPVELIERIEILRGPASSLYGSEAIGGVVQIFTRAASERQGPWAEVGVGTQTSYKVSAGHTFIAGDTRLSLSLGRFSTDGFNATQPSTWGYDPDKDGYRNDHASMRLSHALAREHRLELSGLVTNGRTEFDSGPGALQKQRLSSLAVTSRNRFGPGWESTLRLGQGRDRMRNVGVASRFNTRNDQFQWQNDLRLADGDLLVAVERLRQKVSSTVNYTVDHREVDSVQVGYRTRLQNHGLQMNLRHDDDSQFGGHGSGSLSYGYQFHPQWRFTASVGTAFKAPTFNDLYWPSTPWFRGNPDLSPEKSKNVELGLNWQGGGHSLTAHVYRNRIDDLIVYVFPTMENIADARIDGISLRGRIKMADWSLAANLDLQSPEDVKTGKLLPRRARRHGSISLVRAMERYDVRAEIIANGARFDDKANTKRLDGYAVVHLGLDYRLGKDLHLNARLDNVFDEPYELAKGYNTQGRSLFIGLLYRPY